MIALKLTPETKQNLTAWKKFITKQFTDIKINQTTFIDQQITKSIPHYVIKWQEIGVALDDFQQLRRSSCRLPVRGPRLLNGGTLAETLVIFLQIGEAIIQTEAQTDKEGNVREKDHISHAEGGPRDVLSTSLLLKVNMLCVDEEFGINENFEL